MLCRRSFHAFAVMMLMTCVANSSATRYVAGADEVEVEPVCGQEGDAADDGDNVPRWLTDELQDGAESALLAEVIAEALPDPPARLLLRYLVLEPDSGVNNRTSVGPVLFYIVAGRVTVYVDGEKQNLGPGDSALVPMDTDYAVTNNRDDSVTLLRLSLVPPNSTDHEIINVTSTPNAGTVPIPPRTALLVQDEVSPLPSGDTRLFLACLHVDGAAADLGTYALLGPVGLRVEGGLLEIDDDILIGEGGCAVLQGETVHALRAEDPPPTVLLFGAIPEHEDLWNETDDAPERAEPSPELTCSG